MRLRLGLVVQGFVVAGMVLGACSPPSGGGATPPPRPSASPKAPAIDWAAIPESVDLGGGWSAGSCGGDAPVRCVRRDGEIVGSVEHLSFPVDTITLPGFREATARSEVEALGLVARDYYASIGDDRRKACRDHTVETEPPTPATVAGGRGIRYELRVRHPDRHVVERQIGFSTLRSGAAQVFAASAYEPGGCIGTEGGEFTPDALDEFDPIRERLVAAAGLSGN